MKNITGIKQFRFNYFYHPNGILIPIEGKNDIPFSIARVFYIYNLKKNAIRGDHAHRTCQQAYVCLQGKCEVVCDNGKKKKKFTLWNPRQGLYIPPMIWTIQKFTEDNSIFLVLADQKFNEKDYFRRYKDFLANL
jgi:dTDP-4-dehydrorhamnose 3,5-epimerase-like enzyme